MFPQRPARANRRRIALTLLSAGGLCVAQPGMAQFFGKPSAPFDPARAPPAPDYADAGAWLAYPGRGGLERATVPGETAIDEKTAPVDIFFIHPTTIDSRAIWNAPYDASGKDAPLFPLVLLQQASVFNGCCRIFAPHYRQASLPGLGDRGASGLAYGDVERAFHFYLEHENHGRPFILASHSQGTVHAVRLLQSRILGTPLQGQMVAAYLIGSYVPVDFPTIGMPICDDARQTGCLIAWNTNQAGRGMTRKIFMANSYWWQGAVRDRDQPEMACVNPLTWHRAGAAPASSNPGSLSLPAKPDGEKAMLPTLIPQLTGATCNKGVLDVAIPASSPFQDKLSKLLGSYHLNDYGIFYDALRQNAIDRAAAWLAAHPGKARPE
jgi:hypothetical protein